jgi:hypothetical protein
MLELSPSFRQIMFFDLLELGTLSKPPNIYPRIKLYDYEAMKKMVQRISVNLGGDTSFHGADVSKPNFLCIVFFIGWTDGLQLQPATLTTICICTNSSGMKAIRGQVLRFNHVVSQE